MIYESNHEKYLKNLDKVKSIFKSDAVLTPTNGFESKGEALFEEHKKIVKKVKFDTNLIIFYGLGLGLFYEAARKWLKQERARKVVFIEDSLHALDNFLKSSLAEEILNNPQVNLLFLEEDNFLIKKIAWENVLLKAEILANPFYLKDRPHKFLELKDKLTSEMYGANLIVGDYSDFGERYFKNTFRNLLATKELFLAKDFKGRFKGVPAMICGGGSSISKNISFIKEIQNRALILAGGAGLNILASNNIKPHFAVNIDKTAPHDRFEKTKHLDMPYFVQMQMSHENYLSVLSKKILVPPYGSYPLEGFIYEALNIEQDLFEIGWTVGSAMIAIAAFLGCSPIIFTGLDFCYEKEKYPQNISKGRTVEIIETKDVFGNVVFSQKDWILAKEWIEIFAKEMKGHSFLNANDGGILIRGIPTGSLKDLLKEDFLNIDGLRINERIEALMSLTSSINVNEEEVIKVASKIKESAKLCLGLLDEMIFKIDELCLSSNFSFKTFEAEIFFSSHLLPLWNIFSYVINREVVNQKKVVDRDLALFINRVIFYKNVCEKYLEADASF